MSILFVSIFSQYSGNTNKWILRSKHRCYIQEIKSNAELVLERLKKQNQAKEDSKIKDFDFKSMFDELDKSLNDPKPFSTVPHGQTLHSRISADFWTLKSKFVICTGETIYKKSQTASANPTVAIAINKTLIK
ncbi:hypothetical protein [Parapedobacter defluvii]|uniref:hypothetical protein n=1 Tax=Parapedobacter defluvii TaxID=2045106 RepID=UPI0016642DA5|nr:hypothetical protein [Parapedobacter defluvii]